MTTSRDRLLDAAEALFAERGVKATSVGDIEAAAGFTRRSGVLYKHWASKNAVLSAVIDRHLAVGAAATTVFAGPVDDITEAFEAIAALTLAELDRERALHALLDREGERLADVGARFVTEVLMPTYGAAAELVRPHLAEPGDAEAIVTVLIGGLVNARRNTWTFGKVPLGIDDERLIAAVAAIVRRLTQVESSGPT